MQILGYKQKRRIIDAPLFLLQNHLNKNQTYNL